MSQPLLRRNTTLWVNFHGRGRRHSNPMPAATPTQLDIMLTNRISSNPDCQCLENSQLLMELLKHTCNTPVE